MKKALFILPLILLTAISISFGQSHSSKKKKKKKTENKAPAVIGKVKDYYWGLGLHVNYLKGQYLGVEDPDNSKVIYTKTKVNTILPELSFYFGQNFPLKAWGDKLSVGLSPNLSIGAGRGPAYFSASAKVPLFATCYYGNTATPAQQGQQGFGIGLGAEYHFMLTTFEIKTFSAIRPAMMLEYAFRRREQIWRVRLSCSLPSRYYYATNMDKIPGPSVESFGIHVFNR